MADSEAPELVLLPLGGVGEIGMNLAMYGFGPPRHRQWIIVDCGVTFPGPELPGVELVYPDITFAQSVSADILAIVITHAHEDHYGALLDLWPSLQVPVFATAFTAGLLEAKRQSDRYAFEIPVTIYELGEEWEIGPFSIKTVPVTHSIPEPVSLAIGTPVGTVVHTGDWKLDPAPTIGPKTDEARFREIGDSGVVAVVGDSTNALREGISPSEQDVGASLAEIISAAEGRVAVTTFSSNVGRIRAIAEAAATAGRHVVVMGRSMKRVISVASELGYLDGLAEFLDEEEFNRLPRQEIVLICTGSQGEPRAAISKLSRDEMGDISLARGDTVIYSSRMIPGNERAIIDTRNRLIDRGIIVIEDDDALVHVSGHPRREEIKRLYRLLRPGTVVPVHGEAAHLVGHGEVARQMGIKSVQIRNGDLLRLAPGAAEIIDSVPSGRQYKDGFLIGDFEALGIGQRRKLSYVGHVSAFVDLDDDGELFDEPRIVTYGLPEKDSKGRDMVGLLSQAALGALSGIPRKRRKNREGVEEALRRAIRAEANKIWGKKPVATVFVTRL